MNNSKQSLRTLMFLILLSIFTMVSLPATAADTETEAEYRRLVHEIQRETEAIWGREAGRLIDPKVLTKGQVESLLARLLTAELQKSQVSGALEAMRLLELVPADAPLDAMYQELLSSQVAGLFNPADKSLYVVDTFDPEGFLGRIILSHEIGHAIQDAHYDLAKFLEQEPNTDRQKAKQALIEGDATVLMAEWAAANMDEFSWLSLSASLNQQMEEINNAPPAIVQDLIFSYLAGAEFCTEALQRLGDDWRKQLFEDPPISTEQILHPEKYFAQPRENPVEVRFADLPADSEFEELFRNTLGEWATRLFLTFPKDFPRITALSFDPLIKEERAVEAAAGWGGDLVALYRSGEEKALVWRSVWDTVKDADEFHRAALQRFTKFQSLRGARGTEFGFANGERHVYHEQQGAMVEIVLATSQPALDFGITLLEGE